MQVATRRATYWDLPQEIHDMIQGIIRSDFHFHKIEMFEPLFAKVPRIRKPRVPEWFNGYDTEAYYGISLGNVSGGMLRRYFLTYFPYWNERRCYAGPRRIVYNDGWTDDSPRENGLEMRDVYLK